MTCVILDGQTLAPSNPGTLPPVVGIVTGVGSLLPSFVGYNLVGVYERYAWILTTAIMLFLFGLHGHTGGYGKEFGRRCTQLFLEASLVNSGRQSQHITNIVSPPPSPPPVSSLSPSSVTSFSFPPSRSSAQRSGRPSPRPTPAPSPTGTPTGSSRRRSQRLRQVPPRPPCALRHREQHSQHVLHGTLRAPVRRSPSCLAGCGCASRILLLTQTLLVDYLELPRDHLDTGRCSSSSTSPRDVLSSKGREG